MQPLKREKGSLQDIKRTFSHALPMLPMDAPSSVMEATSSFCAAAVTPFASDRVCKEQAQEQKAQWEASPEGSGFCGL